MMYLVKERSQLRKYLVNYHIFIARMRNHECHYDISSFIVSRHRFFAAMHQPHSQSGCWRRNCIFCENLCACVHVPKQTPCPCASRTSIPAKVSLVRICGHSQVGSMHFFCKEAKPFCWATGITISVGPTFLFVSMVLCRMRHHPEGRNLFRRPEPVYFRWCASLPLPVPRSLVFIVGISGASEPAQVIITFSLRLFPSRPAQVHNASPWRRRGQPGR